MKVVLANNLGFCKGVEKALEKAEKVCSEAENKRIYFFGEIVHNKLVTDAFIGKGAVIIKSPQEIKEPGIVVIRAHGIPDKDRKKLLDSGNEIVDCTCPVVLKGQRLVRESDIPVIILGYKGHSEVYSLCGSSDSDVPVISSLSDLDEILSGRYRGVVQTTFSKPLLDKLIEKGRGKGIKIELVNTICRASIVRRECVEELAEGVEAVVVVGAQHSANAKELVQTAIRKGCPAFLVENENSIPDEVFAYNIIGLTAGASTPESQYLKVKERLEIR